MSRTGHARPPRRPRSWEVIWYDATLDRWNRPERRYPYKDAAARAAASHVLPTYVRRTIDLDSIGLPEDPPPADWADRRNNTQPRRR